MAMRGSSRPISMRAMVGWATFVRLASARCERRALRLARLRVIPASMSE